jgi:PadR family transcriptional regulator PadR
MKPTQLGRLEVAVLLTVARLEDEAYGLNIRRDLHERTGRDYSVGAIYTTLQRLADKGLLKTRIGDPLPVRGGRTRYHYYLAPAGQRTLREVERNTAALWGGLPGIAEGGAQ